eukprot:1154105-Pelagomonas_calceolata.AAC.5
MARRRGAGHHPRAGPTKPEQDRPLNKQQTFVQHSSYKIKVICNPFLKQCKSKAGAQLPKEERKKGRKEERKLPHIQSHSLHPQRKQEAAIHPTPHFTNKRNACTKHTVCPVHTFMQCTQKPLRIQHH